MLVGGLLRLKSYRPVTLPLLTALVSFQGIRSSQDMHICVLQLEIRGHQSQLKLNRLFGGLVERELRKYQWTRKRAQKIPIFVHCAYGHGRSVAVMCALLVALGEAEDWKNAEKMICESRSYIKMNSLHRKSLDEWSKHRLSTPKRNEETDESSVILRNASARSRSDRPETRSD